MRNRFCRRNENGSTIEQICTTFSLSLTQEPRHWCVWSHAYRTNQFLGASETPHTAHEPSNTNNWKSSLNLCVPCRNSYYLGFRHNLVVAIVCMLPSRRRRFHAGNKINKSKSREKNDRPHLAIRNSSRAYFFRMKFYVCVPFRFHRNFYNNT